jgi:hypothetical protein
MKLDQHGDEIFVKRMKDTRTVVLNCLVSSNKPRTYFLDLLTSCILIAVGKVSVSCELSDFLYDIIELVEVELKQFKVGEIYIEPAYYTFAYEFRSAYGLYGYGEALDLHHLEADTE